VVVTIGQGHNYLLTRAWLQHLDTTLCNYVWFAFLVVTAVDSSQHMAHCMRLLLVTAHVVRVVSSSSLASLRNAWGAVVLLRCEIAYIACHASYTPTTADDQGQAQWCASSA
jgi:hypothetical protein